MRAFRLAYDGAPYHGFQRQPDVPTVEAVLFDALAALELHDPADAKPPGYSAAGRTDAGVSARAQTIAVDVPAWCSPAALNAELPAAVRAWASAAVAEDFHAGLAATRRTYRYHLHGPGLDAERLTDAVAALAGPHDFHNLTPDATGTERTIAIDVAPDGPFWTVTVAADGFPRQLVRRLVTLLAEVAAGERDRAAIDRVLAPGPLPGPEGVAPAPPRGLLLAAVDYDVAFTVDPDAREQARGAFAARRVDHAVRARVAGDVEGGL